MNFRATFAGDAPRGTRRAVVGALAFAITTTTASAAPIAPDASALLARVRDAEGATAWAGVRSLGIEGRITASGLDGDYRASEDATSGRFDRASRFAPFSIREVWDGRVAWRQDNSGGVHRLDGDFAVRRSRTDGWLVGRGWLARDAHGAYVGPVEHRSIDGRDLDVVTAIPDGGQAVTLWFDAATLDLARTDRVMPTSVEETRYGDYRDVDGVRLPFAIDTDDHDEDVESLRIARYDLHATAPPDAFMEPASPDDWSMAAPSITVPFDLRNGVLTIEARIDGQGPHRFIFDTGGHSILSPALAQTLGLATVGAGQSGGAGEGMLTEQYTRVPRVDIGGLSLVDQHFYVLPMGYATFERGDQPPLGGILGLELLERFAARIDYPAKTITFTPFASHRFDANATVTPVRFDDDIPLVTGRLDGRDGIFALDTGNAGTMAIQHRWAERIGIADELERGIESASFGAGGVSRNWTSRMPPFTIGGVTLERLVGRIADDRRGSFASRTEAGNIGTQVLANFVLDFDYRRGLMSWQYVPGYVAPPSNRAGVRAMKDRPEDFVVVVVANGSPAARAGVRAQDRIVAIDGASTRTMSGADLNDRFAQAPGTIVRLGLVRDGARSDADVTLEEMLP